MIRRSAVIFPVRRAFPLIVIVPDGAMTLPYKTLFEFKVTPPDATLSCSQSGLLDVIEDALNVNPALIVSTTGPTNCS